MKKQAMYPMVLMVIVSLMLVVPMSVRAAESDEGLGHAFQNTYVYKTFLADDSVTIARNEGVVTLTGTVADQSHRVLAQETVAGLPGVTRVDNQLETEAEVATENADTWIGRKVKLALLFHRNVSFGETEVEVKEGIVTLKGEANDMAQKELTTEYAMDIDDVKDVQNLMTVAAKPELEQRTAGEKIDDASVNAQIKTALFTHRSTSSIETKVVTRSGNVTLTGIAKSEAEKALVTKLVEDIKGVASVDNKMTIEEMKTN